MDSAYTVYYITLPLLDDALRIRYTSPRRGVAQLVAHSVWDAGVVGSNPITPTSERE